MSSFDKIIGYNDIKAELRQFCDMLKNRERYEKLGAKMPRGVLLYGAPGVGKTLMAKSFIEESGLPCFTVRRKDAGPKFTEEVVNAFSEARNSAPAIVFLDDMDKFANSDERHTDSEEFVAVQSCIDESAGHDVFVIATVNEMKKLPASLKRAGRFDLHLHFNAPSKADAMKIIKHYLSDKNISPEVDYDDLAKMMSYSSCSQLETVINDAAIRAAYARKDSVEMDDLTASVLSMQYSIGTGWSKPAAADGDDDDYDDYCDDDDDYDDDDDGCLDEEDVCRFPEEKRKVAFHEAGHIIVSEVLRAGSVGLATIKSDKKGRHGFVQNCYTFTKEREIILIALAGKAAVELYFAGGCAEGCGSDIEEAVGLIEDGFSKEGVGGLGMIDILGFKSSQSHLHAIEAAARTELERGLFEARDILIKNRVFLEKTADALYEKEILLASDIRRIRESAAPASAA